MEEIKRKFSLSIFEIALLVIAVPILFYYFKKIYWMILESNLGSSKAESSFIMLLIFLGAIGAIIVDILWILFAIYGPFENIRVKIYITAFLLTISSVFLYTLIYSVLGSIALSGSMH